MPIILLIDSENEEPSELLILGKSTIGRSSSCDMALKDSKVSGKHGVFELTPKGELFYTDLASSNGSFINGSKVITKIPFKINERLKIGNTTIHIDDKKLNTREKLSIGRNLESENHSSIIVMSSNREQSDLSDIEEKKKNQRRKENIIEQEKSSGLTRHLKIDLNKAKKLKSE